VRGGRRGGGGENKLRYSHIPVAQRARKLCVCVGVWSCECDCASAIVNMSE